MVDYPKEDDFHLRLYRAFHAQRSFLQAGHRETGLGYGQPKLLAYIDRHPACTQRDLAAYYDLDAAGVCRMLDSLERAGFISSSPDPRDRRAKHLRVTSAGKRSLAIWRQHCDQLKREMFIGFSAGERELFEDLLERVYLNLKGKAPHMVGGGDPSTPGLRPSAQDDIGERAPDPAARDDEKGRVLGSSTRHDEKGRVRSCHPERSAGDGAACIPLRHPERSAGEARAESKDPQPDQPRIKQSEAHHA